MNFYSDGKTEIDKELTNGQKPNYFPNACNFIMLDCSFGLVSNYA